jgi:hypothetical protein
MGLDCRFGSFLRCRIFPQFLELYCLGCEISSNLEVSHSTPAWRRFISHYGLTHLKPWVSRSTIFECGLTFGRLFRLPFLRWWPGSPFSLGFLPMCPPGNSGFVSIVDWTIWYSFSVSQPLHGCLKLACEPWACRHGTMSPSRLYYAQIIPSFILETLT